MEEETYLGYFVIYKKVSITRVPLECFPPFILLLIQQMVMCIFSAIDSEVGAGILQ